MTETNLVQDSQEINNIKKNKLQNSLHTQTSLNCDSLSEKQLLLGFTPTEHLKKGVLFTWT